MKLLLFFFIALASTCFAESLPSIQAMDLRTGETLKHDWKDEKKGTVVIFLSSLCPCSNGHINYISELSKEFPDVKFIGMHSNTNESIDTAKEYFKSKELPFPVFQDHSTEWADRLKAFRTPHAFLITPEGKVVYQGGVTSSADPKRADSFYLKVTLKKFLAGEEIESSRTRILGCQIARQ
jgi:hypothetical protein